MPLDALFLSHLVRELDRDLAGARVDKLHMPARDEVVMALRTLKGPCKLLISANGSGARLHVTGEARENPATPPMLCMLLRKHLGSARLLRIAQEPFERVATLTFGTIGELGDYEERRLVLEMMGRGSNIVLTDGEARVIAAMSYIDITEEKSRQLIVGVPYELPKKQDKLSPSDGLEGVKAYIEAADGDMPADKYLLDGVTGLSPLIARECVCRAAGRVGIAAGELTPEQKKALFDAVSGMFEGLDAVPYLIEDAEGVPVDFTFTKVIQYEGRYAVRRLESYSKLLDDYYLIKDRVARAKQRTATLSKLVKGAVERISKKLSHQQLELEEFANRERWRIYGELLQGALHEIPRGAPFVELVNYYEEDGPLVKIPLDVKKSPAANAQLYFKKYQKAKNGEKILREQMEKGASELEYLATVQAALEEAQNERDIAEIRDELTGEGYLAKPRQKGSAKPQKRPAGEPLRFVSKDGFVMLVGKNNRQNDRLIATHEKDDWWLHVLGGAGSHVVVEARGLEVPDATLEEAAMLAALHSKMSGETNVPVTYTKLRNVKKPAGAKPGYVIYTTSRTAYVTPKKG
ncbi:MAG TPA: NFACT RNA binding domain-containing protein [Terriglobales bacterium]|nr:NFACT RNA binding domain-containing protein [Terriglobales bacterium]